MTIDNDIHPLSHIYVQNKGLTNKYTVSKWHKCNQSFVFREQQGWLVCKICQYWNLCDDIYNVVTVSPCWLLARHPIY